MEAEETPLIDVVLKAAGNQWTDAEVEASSLASLVSVDGARRSR